MNLWRCLLLMVIVMLTQPLSAQQKPLGIITGTLFTDQSKPIIGATVILQNINVDSLRFIVKSEQNGSFEFSPIPFGLYRLKVSSAGYSPLQVDSIQVRAERFDFDLQELKLNNKTVELEEVIIYREKPLIENKDGKITFNVGESALSQSAAATDLLNQTPLVTVDSEGKVLLKGKEVKILVDDKPVELNAKQLQDMLESMPGSMIDKIEVLTTPPPQFANERGGVINIVTKKGKLGIGGRVTVNYGTRGEAGINTHFNYRKNKLALNVNGGIGYNRFLGGGFSYRTNIFTDSSNNFNTETNSLNKNLRPNFRLNLEYDFNKMSNLNFSTQLNSSTADNDNTTNYTNFNRDYLLYRQTNRATISDASNFQMSNSLSYTLKTKLPKEQLRVIASFNFSNNENDKDFTQRLLNASNQPLGYDSLQIQNSDIAGVNTALRVNYDRPIKKKWLLNLGGSLAFNKSNNELLTSFWDRNNQVYLKSELLSNKFTFNQNIATLRLALRYDVSESFNVTSGLSTEFTATNFNFPEQATNNSTNNYNNILPFVTIVKKWENDISLNFAYKTSVQRPGINETNPSIDYSDPFNLRFGNPLLAPSFAHNFDFSFGKWKQKFNYNFSLGYNQIDGIYSRVRNLQTDGRTFVFWQNLSGRKEYEASVWGGLTINRKTKANLSIGFVHNQYSETDKQLFRYRDGNSIFGTFNGNYQASDVFTTSASLTLNSFANPQGLVRNNLSMNLGAQYKFFNKKMTVGVNIIDPFTQQRNTVLTYGSNFILESVSLTNTRNYRISIGYNLTKTTKKKTIAPKKS